MFFGACCIDNGFNSIPRHHLQCTVMVECKSRALSSQRYIGVNMSSQFSSVLNQTKQKMEQIQVLVINMHKFFFWGGGGGGGKFRKFKFNKFSFTCRLCVPNIREVHVDNTQTLYLFTYYLLDIFSLLKILMKQTGCFSVFFAS